VALYVNKCGHGCGWTQKDVSLVKVSMHHVPFVKVLDTECDLSDQLVDNVGWNNFFVPYKANI
jgi:hypothetical protein